MNEPNVIISISAATSKEEFFRALLAFYAPLDVLLKAIPMGNF